MWFAVTSVALAQSGPQLDLSRSVPMTSAESLGMGTAGLAFATGAKGMFFHPAAPALRPVESRSRVTGTVALNLSTFTQLTGLDGAAFGVPDDTWAGGTVNLGATVAVGGGGGGLVYSTLLQGTGERFVSATEGHALGAWRAHDVVFGAGYRLVSAQLLEDGRITATYGGQGFETGALYSGLGAWNVAVVWRSRISASSLGEDTSTAVLPAQLGLGAGWVGRAPVLDRPARFTADLIVDGRVERGVSVEAMAYGVAVAKGRQRTVSPRAGVEVEVIEDWLRLRGGTWYEASRTEMAASRLHATGGLEARLFSLPWFGGRELPLSVDWAVDVARDYGNVAWMGLGTWRSGAVGPWVGPRE